MFPQKISQNIDILAGTHQNQHPSSIKHLFNSLYSRYHLFVFIYLFIMNSPVFPFSKSRRHLLYWLMKRSVKKSLIFRIIPRWYIVPQSLISFLPLSFDFRPPYSKIYRFQGCNSINLCFINEISSFCIFFNFIPSLSNFSFDYFPHF